MLATRSMDRGNKAAEQLRAAHPDGQVRVMECDLNSLKSVKDFAEKFNAENKKLDLLVLNAGLANSYSGVYLCTGVRVCAFARVRAARKVPALSRHDCRSSLDAQPRAALVPLARIAVYVLDFAFIQVQHQCRRAP